MRGGSVLSCTDQAVNPTSCFLLLRLRHQRYSAQSLSLHVQVMAYNKTGALPLNSAAAAGCCVLGSLWNVACCSLWMLCAALVETTAIRSRPQHWLEVSEKWGEIKERGCKEQMDQQQERWARYLSCFLSVGKNLDRNLSLCSSGWVLQARSLALLQH